MHDVQNNGTVSNVIGGDKQIYPKLSIPGTDTIVFLMRKAFLSVIALGLFYVSCSKVGPGEHACAKLN